MNTFNSFLHEKWNDFCAMFLIVFGVGLLIWSHGNTSVEDVAKSLVGAGLLAFRLTQNPPPPPSAAKA